MVAVALSPEVVPVPMPSVEEHIQSLKAAARNGQSKSNGSSGSHGDGESNGSNGNSQINAGGEGKAAYLPPPEVAKQIPCRYFPNCTYADKCIFYHPSPSTASTAAAAGSAPISTTTTDGGSSLPSISSAHGMNGANGYSGQQQQQHQSNVNGNGNGHAGYYEQGGFVQPMYYYPVSSEYEVAMQQQQQQQQQGGGSASHNGMMNGSGSSETQQYMQQHQYGQSPVYPGQYYAYPPQQMVGAYGNAQGNPYQHYSVPYMTNAHYAGFPQAAAYAGAMAQQPAQTQTQQDASPSTSTMAIADPAIAPHLPQRSSPVQAVSTSNGATSPVNGVSASHAFTTEQASSTSNNLVESVASPSSASVPLPHIAASPSSPSAVPLSPTSQQQIPQQFVPYYPAAAMPLPAEYQNQPPYAFASYPEAARAQAQMEADFARASLNGHAQGHVRSPSSSTQQQAQAQASAQPLTNGHASSPDSAAQPGESAGHAQHQRSSSLQMHTFFQTGGEPAAGATYTPTAPTVPATVAASTSPNSSVPTARAEAFQPRTRADPSLTPASASTSAPVSGHSKRASFGGFGAAGPSPSSSSRGPFGGAGAPFRGPGGPGPRGTSTQCTFFGKNECRRGDGCFFAHLLDEERPVAGSADGKTTRDAKVLRMNMGGKDGSIAPALPAGHHFGHHGPHGQRAHRPAHAHPHALPEGQEFRPNRMAHFTAQQQQQRFANANAHAQQGMNQPQGQITPAAEGAQADQKPLTNGAESDVKEKFEKLISETPRLSSNSADARSPPVPASAGSTQPVTAAARGSSPAQTQSHPSRGPQAPFQNGHAGSRHSSVPPPHRRGHPAPNGHAFSKPAQRIPNGEYDFPALRGVSSSAPAPASAPAPSSRMERSSSAQSASAASKPASAESKSHPAPSGASAQTQQNGDHPGKKAAFSWASAAAKAASLPDPPKRAPSKPRTAAGHPSGNGKDSKDGKEGKDGKDSKNGEAPVSPAAAPAVTPAGSAESPNTDAVTTAAQVLKSESTAAPALKA